MTRDAAYDRTLYFIAALIGGLLLVETVYGCSRLNYAADVLTGNHQGQACYLKCWSRGYNDCILSSPPDGNYLYDPKVPTTTLIEEYTCDNWPFSS